MVKENPEQTGVRQKSNFELFGQFFIAIVYSCIYTLVMKTNLTPQSILQEISQIQSMLRGKLCVLREGPEGSYYNLQCWEHGKNCSRYVPRDQVPAVQKAIEGYQLFEELMEQYAQHMMAKTREEIATCSKKNQSPRKSSWRKTPK